MLCSEAILVNHGEAEGHATVLHCNRWSCDLCRPLNHSRIKRHAKEGKPNVFLTLTVRPERYETVDAAARDLKQAFVLLRQQMKRELGIDHVPFIAIFERTKKGWPHLHILMRCRFVAQAWYSRTMERLIGAPIVDVRFIQDVGRVGAYVAKYISKAPEAFAHCKRWWRSHDYAIDVEEKQPFARFGNQVEQITGDLSQWLHRTFGGRQRIVEMRNGYVRWTIAPEPDVRAAAAALRRQLQRC